MAGTMLEALSQAGLVDPNTQKESRKRETRQEGINKKRQVRLSDTRGFDEHGIRLVDQEELEMLTASSWRL